MKRFLRVLLFILAIAFGGLLGDIFLTGLDLSGMCFFGAACILLGYVFHILDQKITGDK